MPKRRPSVRTPSRGPRGAPLKDPNELGSGPESDNVKVVVRVRPMNEQEDQSNSIIHVLDTNVLIFDPRPQDSPGSYFRGRRRRQRDLLKRKNRDLKFAFDHVFDENKEQEYVYRNTTKSIIDSVINGYNASVFAYGATGAGKTHTMLGGPGRPGVIYLTMMELYQKINAIQSEKTCNVTVSYLEVYNETIRDLIRPSGQLAIREDPQKGVLVSGLSVHKPKDADELFQMLEAGNSNRTQHPTDANKQSSRSHAVFQVFVRQKDRSTGLKADVRLAKMSLIDLAGSERATVTSNRGARLREGANINKSLLALGNCINALAESKSNGHIPYRNSKLTRLLKDSLGGNCKTVMIAAISPSSKSYEDTYNTLRYANRTKDIKTSLTRNVVSVNYHVTQYAKIVEDLKAENAELKAKLNQQCSQRALSVVPAIEADEQALRYQVEFDKIFGQRFRIRKELLDLESTDRNLAAKVMRKEMLTERLHVLHGSTTLGDKTVSKNHKNIATTRKRQDRLRERKRTIDQRWQENEAALQRLHGEAVNSSGEGGVKPALRDYLHSREMQAEIRDSRRLIRHMRRFSRYQEGHIKASEALISTLLSVVRRQYYLIKGSGLATEAVHSDFEAVQQGVEGTTEVLWADQSQLDDSRGANTSLADQPADESSLNYLLGLPVSRCEIQSPHGPSPKKIRRLTFSQSGAGSPLPKHQTPTVESPPMATPLGASPPAALPEVPTTPADTRVQQEASTTPSTLTQPAVKTPVTSPNVTIAPSVTEAVPAAPSFAEVVSTPAVKKTPVANLSRSPFAPLSTNSPNLGRGPEKVKLAKPQGFEEVAKQGYGNKRTPQHGKAKRIARDKEKKLVVSHPYRRQSLGPPNRNPRNSEYLHKYGIPSMFDSTSSFRSSMKTPAYMSLTKSAANRQKTALDRRRTLTLRNAGPQRVLTKTNSTSNVESVPSRQSGGWKL